MASEGKEIETLETTYYVDPEGYLLDKNHFYILNAQGGQIQLSLKQVELLRNYQMYIARHDCN